jgi:hypothetical protein
MAVYDPRGGGNVHTDRILTNISVGFPNLGFVCPALFPQVTVRKQSDKYYVHGYEAWGQEPGADVRAPGAPAAEIPGMRVSTQPYFAIEHALKILVTEEERQNADAPLSPESEGTELVTSRILLGRELAMKDKATTAGNYASGHTVTLGAGAHWDQATSSPIADWKAGKRQLHSRIFLEPTVGVIPWQTMSYLEEHVDFIERIKYTQMGVLNADLVATMLGTNSIIIPGAGYNTANLNQTVSLAYIWGDDALMAYVPGRPGIKVPAYGYEFVFTFPGGGPQSVDRWYDNDRIGDYIRCRRRYDLRHIALDGSSKVIAGYLIKDTVN